MGLSDYHECSANDTEGSGSLWWTLVAGTPGCPDWHVRHPHTLMDKAWGLQDTHALLEQEMGSDRNL